MTVTVGSTDAGYLTVEEDQRYVLGDLGAPLLTLNAVDSAGVLWACEEPQGWDAPAVATAIDRRQNGHGGNVGESYYEERALSFTGSFLAPSGYEARRARDRLRSAVLASLTRLTSYWHLDDEPAKRLLVRPSGQPRIALDGPWGDFAFVLVAPDPLKLGEEREYGPIRLPGTAGSTGRSYGRMYPYSYDRLIGAPYVENAGDEDGHGRYVLTGPISQPLVQVGLAGEWFALAIDLAGPTPGLAADVAEVDTAAGTVTVNGVLRFDVWVTGSTFPLVPARGGVVRLRSRTGDTNQAGSLYVHTAPTWR